MGALRLYGQRRATGAKGGLFGAMAKKVAGAAARTIPGVGLVSTVASTGLGLARVAMPKTMGALGLGAGSALFGAGQAVGQRVGTSVAGRVAQAWAGPRKKYRRQNVGNMKALRRAIRRIQGAEKLFRQVLSVQGKTHTGIKPKRRK